MSTLPFGSPGPRGRGTSDTAGVWPMRVLWLGAAGAVAAVAVALSGGPRASRGDAKAPHPPLDPRVERIEADLDRLVSRLPVLEDLAERLARLEAGLPGLNEHLPAPQAATVPELDRFEEAAKELSAAPARRAEAIDAWSIVAESATEPARRAEAWFEMSKLCDASMAAELLAQVIETVGLESRLGQDAAYRLGFCQHGNVTESMRIWRELAKVPNLPRELAARTRKMAADMAVTHCDYDLAIDEYQRLVEDYRDDPDEKCREIAKWAAACRANVVKQR